MQGSLTPELDISPLVEQVATEIRRQFFMVERGDILQELWVWVLEHPEKLEEFSAEGKLGERKLHTSLKRAGRAYAVAEKAQTAGYSVDDNYWYSTATLREILPQVLDRDVWTEPGVPQDTGKISRTSPASEGNNRLAMLCDVRDALEGVSQADKLLLWTHYGLQLDLDEHALSLGITTEALRTRVTRAISRLQRRLGGPRPDAQYVGRRKALSNVQAQSITKKEMGEE